MNENLNLVEILKDVPKGTEFFTTTWGNVKFVLTEEYRKEAISVLLQNGSYRSIYSNGSISNLRDAECIIFPSKDQRDWSKFEPPLRDKELVWCWDDSANFRRVVAFYDAKNKSAFCSDTGKRCGYRYDNYERFKGKWPEWAKEAFKKLED